jgi:hypothetical protein
VKNKQGDAVVMAILLGKFVSAKHREFNIETLIASVCFEKLLIESTKEIIGYSSQ